MPLGIFRKTYAVRRMGPQKVIDGHAASAFSDAAYSLNVQPKAPDKHEAREEGDLTVKRVRAWGPGELSSADELTGKPGDLLFYKDRWYECVSCARWHNLLGHYQSEFTALPADRQPPPPGPMEESP